MTDYIRWLETVTNDDIEIVGGKNASLGQMIQNLQAQGVHVPDGFATTATAYRAFLAHNGIEDAVKRELDALHAGEIELATAGRNIRRLFLQGTEFPPDVEEAIREAYAELEQRYDATDVDVAVRSSASAEDLPDASFAGQQETYLNITGATEVLAACRRCYASLFTNRAITYREEKGFDHLAADLAVGVQKMVRADKAGAGVMFTLDTETGFPDVVVINAGWGLGENVVQGSVNPDEYRVFKPQLKGDYRPIIEKNIGSKEEKVIYATGRGNDSVKTVATSEQERRAMVLSDDEILQLARWAVNIEDHYGQPMDIEWAKDGDDSELYVIQARPETVQARRKGGTLMTYRFHEDADPILTGIAIGGGVSTGKVQVIRNAEEIDRFEDGSILVTGITDPDWVPIMKKAAGIVTDYGGRTSHAAIVSRELGLPAIVGTNSATTDLKDGQEITMSCVEAKEGYVYEGVREYEAEEVNLDDLPHIDTQVMMNIASPLGAFRWWRLPVQGVGLARMEFIINNVIQAHPMALIHYDKLEDADAKAQIAELTRGYDDKTDYFVENLSYGVAQIAAAQYPHDVIVRMSDFKTSEYADLIGGKQFEPHERNPMLGFRGAARYSDEKFRQAFELECRAIKRAREVIGLDNIVVMIPFCRTLTEADKVLEIMAENGLQRGDNGLRVYVMAEIPANIILARQFAQRFDGFSIGSNDLTQLTLGVDRDSETLAALFDERNEAVKVFIQQLITDAHAEGCKVGICGEAPSTYPDFAAFLVKAGIDSISVSPDSVVQVFKHISEQERMAPTV